MGAKELGTPVPRGRKRYKKHIAEKSEEQTDESSQVARTGEGFIYQIYVSNI